MVEPFFGFLLRNVNLHRIAARRLCLGEIHRERMLSRGKCAVTFSLGALGRPQAKVEPSSALMHSVPPEGGVPTNFAVTLPAVAIVKLCGTAGCTHCPENVIVPL